MAGKLTEWWRYRRMRREMRRANRAGRAVDPSEMHQRVRKYRSASFDDGVGGQNPNPPAGGIGGP
jgi:hypothetical protein